MLQSIWNLTFYHRDFPIRITIFLFNRLTCKAVKNANISVLDFGSTCSTINALVTPGLRECHTLTPKITQCALKSSPNEPDPHPIKNWAEYNNIRLVAR